MPGRLIMNQEGVDGVAGSRDGQDTHGTAALSSRDSKTMVNGNRGASQPDGLAQVNGVPPSSTAKNDVSASLLQMPPEVRHITEGFVPLSKLFVRTSQDCFNDLSETLTSMADIPVAQQANGQLTNGVGAHALANGAGNNNANNVKKKRKFMEFAENQRAKFMKLLVISQWARRADEVSRLIDVRNWTWEMDQNYFYTLGFMRNITLEMQQQDRRLPSPDIKTALEVLSSGKAPWIPDMGFIPPEPLSAEKSLKLLRNLNTELAIRLNLHEELPQHLKNWRIASGRATFVVPTEFEVDVSSYSEDTSMPWFFIDLRLLFSPAPVIPTDSRTFIELDHRANATLSHSGLDGLYTFLHDFILTYKIGVLKAQAFELLGANWAGSLKVDSVHRFLCVQYWKDTPGKKNWIEISIASGRPKNGKVSWRGPTPPFLVAKWYRQGVEVTDTKLHIDWRDLSMERILRHVIAFHTSHIMNTTKERFLTSAAASPRVQATVRTSIKEPSDCALEASLGHPKNATSMLIDPIMGKFALRPCNQASIHAESDLNRMGTSATVSNRIALLLISTLQRSIFGNARYLGWTDLHGLNVRLDALREAVKVDVQRYCIFRGPGWNTNWALAAVIGSTGDSWWILELRHDVKGASIVEALPIAISRDGPVSREFLERIERVALAQIPLTATARVLDGRKVPYKIRTMENVAMGSSSSSSSSTPLRIRGSWVLWIGSSALMAVDNIKQRSCLQGSVRVTYQGYNPANGSFMHTAKGQMAADMGFDMRKLMASSSSHDIVFSEDGDFSISLRTSFGEEFADQLTARLHDIDRLRALGLVLQKRKLVCKYMSLKKVVFQYNGTLTASLFFESSGKIKVGLDKDNPHNLIENPLSQLINNPIYTQKSSVVHRDTESSLDNFMQTLIFTLPFLRALLTIKESDSSRPSSPAFHAHTVKNYRLSYKAPQCSFDISFRNKEDRPVWLIEDGTSKAMDSRSQKEQKGPQRSDKLEKALKALFRSRGNDWTGVRSGIVAGIEGADEALRKLHEVVMSCQDEEVNKGVVATSGGTGSAGPSTNTQVNGNANPAAKRKPSQATGPAAPNRPRLNTAKGNGGGAEVITID